MRASQRKVNREVTRLSSTAAVFIVSYVGVEVIMIRPLPNGSPCGLNGALGLSLSLGTSIDGPATALGHKE